MTVAIWLFATGGVMLIGIGMFFVFVRPPLLPEDLRFLGRSSSEIEELLPQLRPWLRRVFAVLGGHAIAAGGLTLFVALADVRGGGIAAIVALALAGGASIGLMTAVNFAIRSDFRWMLLGTAVLWTAAVALALATPL